MDRSEVYLLIDGEREYQDKLGPGRTDGSFHSIPGHLLIMDTYYRAAVDGWTRNPGNEVALDNVRKLAATCIRCMEEEGAPARRGTIDPVVSMGPLKREEVYTLIDGEREYQKQVWDDDRPEGQTPDEDKGVAEWLLFIGFCLDDAKRAAYYPESEYDCLAKVRKVAALCVACMEFHGAPSRWTKK